MANYNIDIVAQIKGNEKLTRFNERLKGTAFEVKQLNTFLKEFQQGGNGLVRSFNNLNQVLLNAKANFNAVASGTQLQEKAARQLIIAEKELNAELQQREALLQRLSTAPLPLPGTGLGRDRSPQSFKDRNMKGKRSSLVPGESLFGQSVNIEGRSLQILKEEQALQEKLGQMQQRDNKLKGESVNIEERIKKILVEEKALQDGLLKLEQQSTQELEEKFLLRTKNRTQLDNEIKKVKALRQAEITQAATEVEQTKQQVANEIQINAGRRERMVMANQELQFEIKLNRMLDQRRIKQKNQAAISNAVIGGAFPLLFGQGLGASIGGATGGFAGGKKGGQFGFALSLLGTVVGAQFDKLAQSARELGEALRNPIKNMDMLVTKMGQANTPFADTVATLKDLGLEAVAAGQVLDNFNKTFGTNKTQLSQLGEESIRFTNELTKLGTGISLFVAGPLTFFLEKINAALGFQTVDEIRDRARGQAIKEKRIELGVLRPDGSRGPLFFLKQLFEPTIRNMPDVKQRSFELFERDMNAAGLGGQAGTRDFSNENLQRIIKERRDFQLSTMKDQLIIQKESLTMRSEDLDVLKRRIDVLKIEEKLKVKGLVDTTIMTDEQKRAHEFAIDKLEVEKQVSEELLRQAMIMSDPIKAALIDLNKEMEKLNDMRFQSVEFAKAFGGAFEESFKGIIKGTMTVADAFRNMFMRIADHFLDMAAQMMANSFQRGILGMLANIFSPFNFGNDIQGPAPGFTPPQYAANGGPAGMRKPYIVGERGPELFVPNQSGNIIPNHDLGGISGSTNITVNVDASGSSVEGDETQAEQLGQAISQAIQAELIQQQRPGGLLYS